MSRRQLLELGLSERAIDHRLAKGRLHRIERGVYAVGRPTVTRRGRWMALVLSLGPRAFLSHGSAAVLWGIASEVPRDVEISLRAKGARGRSGVRIHRRPNLRLRDTTTLDDIPVTGIVRTMIDLAHVVDARRLERAVNEADRLDLIRPERLLAALDAYTAEPGVGRLRRLLGRHTFRLTDSELERRFLRLIDRRSIGMPETGVHLNGFKVDFYWPDLGLVVETDGLRYHRTPAQQSRDRRRDQAHTAAGLTPLRFTHEQVRFEESHVRETLRAVVARIRRARST